MKTFYLWKLVNGKKFDIVKISGYFTKEDIKKRFSSMNFDGIDVVISK